MTVHPRFFSRALKSFVIVGFGAFLFGCQESAPETQAITLKIAGVMPVFFEAQYGNSIRTENYDITIEFVPYELIPRDGGPSENLENLYSSFQPDVVNWSGALSPLIDQGLLAPLDVYIQKSGFDASVIPDVLKQRITKEGSNEIYAIPNRFSTEALFYNRSMLDQFEIELSDASPLSWEQLFQLAAIVPPEDGQGNAIIRLLETGEDESDANKLFSLIRIAALAENLQAINKDNGDVYVNSSSWQKLWQTFIAAFNQKLISSSEDIKPFIEQLDDEQSLRMDDVHRFKPFTDGRAAFVLGNSELLFYLQREELDFEWGIAPQPGTYQVFTQLAEALLINPSSEHKDAAWELISYLSSAEQTQRFLLAKPGDANQLFSNFPMHMDLLEQHLNRSLAPFYNQPSSQESYFDASPLPDVLSLAIYESSLSLIEEVLKESLSVEEALEQLQVKLESISAELFEGE
ncbi:hypothetical protein A7K91_20770 [Paenibacillus oryzae]|uniref:ABC transporter substrate-binding protein n=2 Tax=Paenibacillus oryzae TaxID=1844972 RepID=A0A1A5YKN9_9BACL|nr:hypothetical protein A7K91_20770 [Paenibacillus oryzae]